LTRVNESIPLTVTITNTGGADALNVSPSLAPSGAGNPVLDSGPTPVNATIKSAQTKTFSYAGHGQTTGTATFTANLSSGTDKNSGANITATGDEVSVTIQSPPSYGLSSTLSASPTAVNASSSITVTMSVQNTGSSTLTNIVPSSIVVGGSSSDAIYATGPVPANVASLGAAAQQSFTWTYTAGSTLGTVNFTGNAVATQTQSASSSSNNVTIQAGAASLSSSIAATPASLLTNAAITVRMTVTNTAAAGSASAQNVRPSLLTLGGTSGVANLVSGPTPANATIAAGASNVFVWTYKAGITPGTVTFTGNASGTDANSGAEVASASNASNSVSLATLSAQWMYPADANVTGPVRTIPIAYGNKIYFGSDDDSMYVLNNDTKVLSSSFASSGQIRGVPWPSTEEYSPGVYKDVVYFGTLGKTIYAVWEDNAVKWERVMGESLSTSVLYDYVSGIYFGTTDQKAYCLSADDGQDAWAQPATVGGAIESSPAMIYVPTLFYDEIYFGASDGKMYGFKAADGTGARVFDTGFGEAGAIKTAPSIGLQVPSDPDSRRLLLFGTENGKFYAVNTQNLSASFADTGWTTNPVSTGGAIYSGPWVDTETSCVYFGSRDGKLYALNLSDGTSKANFPVDVGSPIDSWPLVANGVAYFGADNGKFYAISTSTGNIVDGWPYNTGAPVKSGVSLQYIDDDNIFVLFGSDSGRIYSFKIVESS
jgi:outer membrane protein assembly factor BamB